MRPLVRAVRRAAPAAIFSVVLAVSAAPIAAAQGTSLEEQINNLTVASESNADTYDRDAFGDYDRDAILARNFEAFPDCEGYFSFYDGECYALAEFGGSKEAADDEVDIDHAVALQEAWTSGASQWSEAKLDRFGGYAANLAVMTDNLNQSKGSQDVTGWIPPRESTVCEFVQVVVDTKAEFGLSVDQDEKDRLLDLASGCGASNGGGGTDGGASTGTGDGTGNGGSGDDGTGSDGSYGDGTDNGNGTAQVEQVPVGGVDTGGGPGGDAAAVLLGGIALTSAAGVTAFYARRLRREDG